MPTAMDAYGFAGGFTMGVVQAGFELRGKREASEFGIPACEANRHLLGDNWEAQQGDPAQWVPEDVDLVFGNPPCSGFSLMSVAAATVEGDTGRRRDYRGVHAPVNACMWNFTNFAAKCNPDIAIFESVTGAAKLGLPLMRDLRSNLEEKTSDRWDLYHVIHDAASVGGAALCRRYFWVASRIPFGIELPEVTRVP